MCEAYNLHKFFYTFHEFYNLIYSLNSTASHIQFIFERVYKKEVFIIQIRTSA